MVTFMVIPIHLSNVSQSQNNLCNIVIATMYRLFILYKCHMYKCHFVNLRIHTCKCMVFDVSAQNTLNFGKCFKFQNLFGTLLDAGFSFYFEYL